MVQALFISKSLQSKKINTEYSQPKDLNFSVTQGSVARLSLYSVHASTMCKYIPHNINLPGYADDHTL